MAGFDTKEMMNRAIRYMAEVATQRAAGGWVPPKEQERQQREAMRQEQQQARQAEREQQAQQKQFITDEKERQKNLEAFQKGNHPDVPHVVYHGTGSEHDGDFRVPSFFTSDPQGAEWYAKNRGDNPQIFPVHLSMKKPLDTRSKEGIFKLINIAHNAGVHVELKETPKGWQFTSNDIAKHSPYEGDNPLDLLYIPKVRNALYQNGHDGVIASDVLSNDEIPTFIPLHSQQIKSATGNQGTFNPSASDITKSEGGQILSKQFPTQYMPNVGRQVMQGGGVPDQPQRQLSPMGFYSAAAERASALQPSGDAVQMVNSLRNLHGVKTEELQNAGLIDQSNNVHPDWAGRGKVTRDELASHLRGQMPQIEERVLGYNKNIPGWEIVNQDGKYMLRRPDGSFHTAPNSDIPATWSNETAAQAALNFNAKDSSSATKYSEYALPGGENYREVLLKYNPQNNLKTIKDQKSALEFDESLQRLGLLSPEAFQEYKIAGEKLPKNEIFKSPHWDDPNVIAHIRMSDRIGPNGEKILHVEELQSDWGQKGKKEGFKNQAEFDAWKKNHSNAAKEVSDARQQMNDYFNDPSRKPQFVSGEMSPREYEFTLDNYRESLEQDPKFLALRDAYRSANQQYVSLQNTKPKLSGIAPAPYVTSTEGWTDLALKRVLKEAAEGGYHKVVWTPGEEQAERYDLKNHVSQIFYRPDKEYLTYADIDGGWIDHPDPVTPEKLPEVIGKDAAERLLSQTPDSNDGSYRLRGEDLSFGGEGMKGYYDNIVPKRLQAIAKKHDKNAKVGYTDIMLPAARRKGSNNPPIQAPGIDITPEMRESILRGQSAYADGGEVEREGFAGGGSPDDDMIRDALSRVASPFSDNPELAAKAVEIANQAYKVPTGNITAGPSYYGFKGPMNVSDIQTTVEPLPGVSPAEKNPMSWEDFYKVGKGGTMINLGGDRSRLGRLTHINGKELAWPVDLHAGPEYMLEPNPGAVWANAPGHTSGLRNKILQAADKGPVYGVYTPMGPKTVDSSFQMFDALLSQIAADPPSKKVAKQLDDALKQAKFVMGSTDKAIKDREKEKDRMQNWPGILNALEAREHAKTLPGSTRSLIVKYLDRAAWHQLGVPHIGMTRAAITNPDLLGAPANMMGHRIVELSPEEIEETAFKHNTYKSPTGGKYVGDVPLVQRQYAMPDVMDQFLSRRVGSKGDVIMHPYSLQSGGRDAARKMLEEQKQMQPVSQRMLDSIQQGLERQSKYGLKSGGKVKKHPALSIAGTHIREETHGEPIFTGRL